MSAPIGTLAETRTAIAMVRHLANETNQGVVDAAHTLRGAPDDQGVRVEKVALVLAQLAMARTKASHIDVELWASIAMPAAEDWEHEADAS